MKKTIPHIFFVLVLVSVAFLPFARPKSSTAEINTIEITDPAPQAEIPTLSVDTTIRDVPSNPQIDEEIANTPVPEEKPQVLDQATPVDNPTPPPATQPAPTQAPKPVVKTTPPPAPTPSVTCSGSFSDQFLCYLNAYRKSKGLNALTYESSLNSTAQYHSTWMSKNNTLSHVGADGSRFFERCIMFGTACDAENVAKGYTNAKRLLDAWIASPGHNKNLLGSHTVIGLSLVGIYATMDMR